jgi:hypothetical protein
MSQRSQCSDPLIAWVRIGIDVMCEIIDDGSCSVLFSLALQERLDAHCNKHVTGHDRIKAKNKN